LQAGSVMNAFFSVPPIRLLSRFSFLSFSALCTLVG